MEPTLKAEMEYIWNLVDGAKKSLDELKMDREYHLIFDNGRPVTVGELDEIYHERYRPAPDDPDKPVITLTISAAERRISDIESLYLAAGLELPKIKIIERSSK